MADPEPKHPYVTSKNAKIHWWFSIAVGVMSTVQIILGIIINEMQIKEIVRMRNTDANRYWEGFDNWYFADHVYVGCAGIILALLGFSVYRYRSRSNGIILSVMCFFSGFIIYPAAAILGGLLTAGDQTGINSLRGFSAVYTALQAIVIIAWAFYSATHTCCNSNVKTQIRLNIQGQGSAVGPQQQVVYVQGNPGGQQQYIQQGAPQYAQQGAPQYAQQGAPQYVQQGAPQYAQQGAPQYVQQGPTTICSTSPGSSSSSAHCSSCSHTRFHPSCLPRKF
ncbi:uncharacterized protein LOC134825705 [Bolinopsis microptera]|uniref:uncharacterized protein LOC134825705 n=1 Tax=Bolinopsis microptera TaxID=2820187 RepID=UPI00307A0A43